MSDPTPRCPMDPADDGAEMSFDGRMSYSDYLHTDAILTAQHLLTGAHATEIVPGDVLTVICAVLWGLQILFAGKAMAECPRPLTLAATQFGVCVVLAFALSLPTENIDPLGIALAAPEILFAGIISGGLAFTLQIIGQRHTTPAAAALILSTEAMFAALYPMLSIGVT